MSRPEFLEIEITPEGTEMYGLGERGPWGRIAKAIGGHPPEIRRASNVVATPDGEWVADLSPSGGPRLGPFPTRREALDAEVDHLASGSLRSAFAGGESRP